MIYIITFMVFAVFFIAMSLGLLIKQRPLQGSCGGVAKLMGNDECEICGGDPNQCESQQQDNAKPSADGFYDAS